MTAELDRAASGPTSQGGRPQEEVWRDYAARVGELGSILSRAETPRDEVTLAEGHRHLARMLYMGLLATHEYADTEAPEVFLATTPT